MTCSPCGPSDLQQGLRSLVSSAGHGVVAPTGGGPPGTVSYVPRPLAAPPGYVVPASISMSMSMTPMSRPETRVSSSSTTYHQQQQQHHHHHHHPPVNAQIIPTCPQPHVVRPSSMLPMATVHGQQHVHPIHGGLAPHSPPIAAGVPQTLQVATTVTSSRCVAEGDRRVSCIISCSCFFSFSSSVSSSPLFFFFFCEFGHSLHVSVFSCQSIQLFVTSNVDSVNGSTPTNQNQMPRVNL